MKSRYWRDLPTATENPGRMQSDPHSRARHNRHRIEWPTLGVALVIYGGFLLVTLLFADLPLFVAAPLLSVLLTWYGSLQHETIHGHPTPDRRFNEMLGSLPLSLWIPYTVYRETHLRHHRHGGRRLTQVAYDPESFYLPTGELSRFGHLRRWIYRANCTLAGRLILGPALAVTSFWSGELRRVRSGDRRRLRIWARHSVGVCFVLAWTVGVCHISLWVYLVLIVYPSVSLNHVRSFAEHVADSDPRLRTRVVEAHPFWALLFLNNNLHIAHHAKPKMAWFQLPHAWHQMRAPALERGLVFAGGYREVMRKYLLRPYIRLDHDGG
ncbi:MAG: fatty acid desaturase [Proteobacteria bacterium]|nr:fatty acid desaturase [Pseudomonadota bacterium]